MGNLSRLLLDLYDNMMDELFNNKYYSVPTGSYFGPHIQENKNHGWIKVAKNCLINYYYFYQDIFEPFIFYGVIPDHNDTNIIVEIIFSPNGLNYRVLRDEHQILSDTKDKNIYIYKMDTALFEIDDDISKMQCIFKHFIHYIQRINFMEEPSQARQYQRYQSTQNQNIQQTHMYMTQHEYLNNDEYDSDYSDCSDDSDDSDYIDDFEIYLSEQELEQYMNFDDYCCNYEEHKEIDHTKGYLYNINRNGRNGRNIRNIKNNDLDDEMNDECIIYQILNTSDGAKDISPKYGRAQAQAQRSSISTDYIDSQDIQVPQSQLSQLSQLSQVEQLEASCIKSCYFYNEQHRRLLMGIQDSNIQKDNDCTQNDKNDDNNNTLSLSQKVKESYERITYNFPAVYGNCNNNNNMAVKGESDVIINVVDEDIMDKIIYVPNPKIEHEKPPSGIQDVANHIKLETANVYNNILQLGNGFDDIYADDNDNVLIIQQQKVNIKDNHPKNIKQIQQIQHKPSVDDNNSNIQNNDGDHTDDEYKYDEQKEGHSEVIDEKTYIFPREYKNIGPVFSYGKNWSTSIQPKYKHLKEEVLNNKYAPITEKTWNGILEKCINILKGEFANKRKNRWSKLLRDNKIGLKHLVALKLYTDFDLLQREFRKSFRAPYNKAKERLQAFFHWRQTLQETFGRFSNIPSALSQPSTLFHGINSIMCLDQYQGYYYGPCSTTTDLHVARSFAGKNGMILVMKPETNTRLTPYKVLDISWISDYPDEREYLLFDHKIEIETWILSSDYDQYYFYYHNTLTKKNVIKGPSGHLSYQNQKKIPKHLSKLKLLIQEIEVKPVIKTGTNTNNNTKVKIKQNLDFDNEEVEEQEKIDLLIFMFQFALGYKYGKKKPSKYDQSLNANIQHVMKTIHIMQVPPKLVNDFMEQLRIKYHKEMSAYFIRSVLNEYFINTYVPLDAVVDASV